VIAFFVACTEESDPRKVQEFYKQNFSLIYVLFHDSFTAVEPSIGDYSIQYIFETGF